MLRISKLADYGTVVLAFLATHPDQAYNARQIANQTRLTLPTVSKVLKILAREGLLVSQRGMKGGYRLAYSAENISVAQIVSVMDGTISLTECSHGVGVCQVEHYCAIQHNWQIINDSIKATLAIVSLADIIKPMNAKPIIKLNFHSAKQKVLNDEC